MLGLADYVATASKDPSTQVGAVLVDTNRVVRGIGYNGFPRRVEDLSERYLDRDTKYKLVVHAEINALLTAGDARGCYLFCTSHVCSACAAAAVQAGVSAVFCRPVSERWAKDAEIAALILREAGVRLEILDD